MKKSYAQAQAGVVNYMQHEFCDKLQGIDKALMIGATLLLTQKWRTLADKLLNNSIVKSLDLVDADGMIDIDLLRDTALQTFDKMGGSGTQVMPIVGTTTFTREDVDKVYREISAV